MFDQWSQAHNVPLSQTDEFETEGGHTSLQSIESIYQGIQYTAKNYS